MAPRRLWEDGQDLSLLLTFKRANCGGSSKSILAWWRFLWPQTRKAHNVCCKYSKPEGHASFAAIPNHWDTAQLPQSGYKVLSVHPFKIRDVTCNTDQLDGRKMPVEVFMFERETRHLIVLHCFSREFPLCPHRRNIRKLKHFSVKPWEALTSSKSRGFRTKLCGIFFSCKCVSSSITRNIFICSPFSLFVGVYVVYIGLSDLCINPGRKPRWRTAIAAVRCWRWSFFMALTINTWTPSATLTLTGDSVVVMEQLSAKVR